MPDIWESSLAKTLAETLAKTLAETLAETSLGKGYYSKIPETIDPCRDFKGN